MSEQSVMERLRDYLRLELEASRKSDAALGWETARTEQLEEFCEDLHSQDSDEGKPAR